MAIANDEAKILRLALLCLEETMNEVIGNYLEGVIPDGGEELVQQVAVAIEQRYQQIRNGSEDEVLAAWRRNTSIN
jgi:hypothetical protein